MKWNADKALKSNETNCFLNNISVGKSVEDTLEAYKEYVRGKITETFKELNEYLFTKQDNWHFEAYEFQVFSDDNDDILKLCELINKLDLSDRNELLKIHPRFMTQGSMHYKTLNKPAYTAPKYTPPQQIDIDDGVYIPLDIFEDQPKLSHQIFLLIIKVALLKVQKEKGWQYKQGKMCATLEIDAGTHLDVPMYAVPKEQFLEKEKARKNRIVALNSSVGTESVQDESRIIENIYLDPDNVYLAVTTAERWKKSDPAVVCRWFEEAVKLHGEQIRRVCKYLKAWRDYNFREGGVSSIALMACAVEVFDNYDGKFERNNDTKPLYECSKKLHTMLVKGIDSPDPSDEEKLFPRQKMDSEYINDVLVKASDFEKGMYRALEASTNFSQTRSELMVVFGDRLELTPNNLKFCVEEIVNNTPIIPQGNIGMPKNSVSG